jgi:hypothetical protein
VTGRLFQGHQVEPVALLLLDHTRGLNHAEVLKPVQRLNSV